MNKKKLYKIIIVMMLVMTITACKPNTPQENEKNTEKEQKDLDSEKAETLERFEATFFDYFNTITQIIVYAENESTFDSYKQIVNQKLEYYHKLFDIYNKYDGVTNVYILNQKAIKEPIKVEKELFDFLQYCKQIHQLTNGQVNIAFGSVLKIWHNYREDGLNNPEQAILPSKEELEKVKEHTNIEDLILDEKEQSVYFADNQLQLDVGAIAKGYSVQKIVDELKDAGLRSGLISAGGNVTTIGEKPEQQKWQVGIQNPDRNSDKTVLKALELTDESLVTSGDYERYYEVNGEIYHHIIDPKTLFPARYFHQVSILTEDSGLADALSTSIFLMSYEEGKKLIDSLEQVEAAWVFPDYHIEVTKGLESKIVQ